MPGVAAENVAVTEHMVPPVAHGLVPARVTVRPGGDGSTRGSSLDGRDVVNRILSGVPKGLGQPLCAVAVRVIALLVAPAARGPTLVALEEIVTKGTPVVPVPPVEGVPLLSKWAI